MECQPETGVAPVFGTECLSDEMLNHVSRL
jgi:hypothetical protein